MEGKVRQGGVSALGRCFMCLVVPQNADGERVQIRLDAHDGVSLIEDDATGKGITGLFSERFESTEVLGRDFVRYLDFNANHLF